MKRTAAIASGLSSLVALILATRAMGAPAPEIPRLVTDAAGGTRLFVDGKPFTVLGGELGNSNASNAEQTRQLFADVAKMKLNTVLLPVSWELIEPAEGKWSFDLLTNL